MVSAFEAASLILVGACWGCTNPMMRKGFVDSKAMKPEPPSAGGSTIWDKLAVLVNFRVWLPYAINQLGSLLYYKTLGDSAMTMSVPVCNATAVAFSSLTSVLLGERVDQPGRAALGVLSVMLGVAICMHSSDQTT
mmetsp:Transcript_8476/g.19912  ORF Transcript_8476/g.19912 Transcript_8476/m.19912 type:complete len:136 (+) Transcript_8476:203-610(+)